MKRYIAYQRVSTAQQDQSGLGLEAQRASILRFINGNADVLAWFVEVESGTDDNRPQFNLALNQCGLTGATLIVATLDRLPRDEAVLRTIRDAGVAFPCADMPYADELVLDLMARLARYEREAISRRTKAALAAAKARGVKLGCKNGVRPMLPKMAEGRRKGAQVNRTKADQWAEKRRGLFEELAELSLSAAAKELNARHISTQQDRLWTKQGVKNVRDRLGL